MRKHKQIQTLATKWVGNRFHELSLGRNDWLGLGTSKIEVLAKSSKKKQGKSMVFLVFPACGVGCLTSYDPGWRPVVNKYVARCWYQLLGSQHWLPNNNNWLYGWHGRYGLTVGMDRADRTTAGPPENHFKNDRVHFSSGLPDLERICWVEP